MLGYKISYYGSEFINCYVIPGINPKIVLVFEDDKQGTLPLLVKELQIHDNFLSSEYKEGKVILTFTTPAKFEADFRKFVTGRYSKFSDEYKILIKSLFGDGHIIPRIVNPTAQDRKNLSTLLDEELPPDAEVYDIPDMEEEVYKEEILNNN